MMEIYSKLNRKAQRVPNLMTGNHFTIKGLISSLFTAPLAIETRDSNAFCLLVDQPAYALSVYPVRKSEESDSN